MSAASIEARRAQPVTPRASGIVLGEPVVVWSNWDRLEVRTERDAVLLAHEAQGHLLDHSMAFLADRYLVTSIGTGIMRTGFKVYDFESGTWPIEFVGPSVDIGFCGAHPTAPLLVNEEREGLALWDVSAGRRLRMLLDAEDLESTGVNAAAVGGPDGPVAIGTFGEISILRDGRRALSVQIDGGDVTALEYDLERSLLLCGNVNGDVTLLRGNVQGKTAQGEGEPLDVTYSFAHAGKQIHGIRISPHHRFAAVLSHEGKALFMDLEDGRTAERPDVHDVTFCPTDPARVFVASSSGLRRLAVDSLFSP